MNDIAISLNDPMSDIPTCKYCLGEDSKSNLIMPCRCSGTQAFVHRACLDRWRSTDQSQDKFSKCLICNTDYEYVASHSYRILKIKLILLVCADITFAVIIMWMIILILAVLSWLAGLADGVVHGWNMNIITASILIGLIEFFVLIGWMGLLAIVCANENMAVYFCLGNLEDRETYIILVIFMLFGIVIGIVAFIRLISYRIEIRSEQHKHELFYTVANRT